MYCHSFLVTSVRGIGLLPTTAESMPSGCTGLMNAAFGLRFAPPRFFPAFFREDFFAPLRPPFFAPRFLPRFVAMRSPMELVNGVVFPSGNKDRESAPPRE